MATSKPETHKPTPCQKCGSNHVSVSWDTQSTIYPVRITCNDCGASGNASQWRKLADYTTTQQEDAA